MIAYILIRQTSSGMWKAESSVDGKPCVAFQPTKNKAVAEVLESLKNALANGRCIDSDYKTKVSGLYDVIQVHLPDNPGKPAA